MDMAIITSRNTEVFCRAKYLRVHNICMSKTLWAWEIKTVSTCLRGRNLEINPQARNSLYIMMTEHHYEIHKTSKIVSKLQHFPSLNCVENRAPSCHSCTRVPSCLKPSQSLQRHMSALSDTLIIGNINFNLLTPLRVCSAWHFVWMWVTDSSNTPSYRFTFYITWEIDGSDVWLLFLSFVEQQQETGVASSSQGCLENPPAAGEVEGEAAPQGESMGGRERGLLKTTDNLRTLSHRGGKGCIIMGPSLKTSAGGGAPRKTMESPHKAGELTPCWLLGCGVKTREHLQLGCTPSDRWTRSDTVQRVQVKGDKLNRGLAPPLVCKIKDTHWSCRCQGQSLLLLWTLKKNTK